MARPSRKALELLSAAVRLLEANDLVQGEQACRAAIAADRSAGDAWNLLAFSLLGQQRLDEAATAAERAVAFGPKVGTFWVTRGNVAAALGRTALAQESYARGAALEPENPDAHYGLARCLIAAERWQDAVAPFQRAFELDPDAELDRKECIDSFRYLDFASLPDFWHAETLRFFERGDIDRSRYVLPVLKLLKSKAAIQSFLAWGGTHDGAPAAPSWLDEVASDALLGMLLRDTLIVDAGFEFALTKLRRALLANAALRERLSLAFLCDFALQCFNNEYAYVDTDAGLAAADLLADGAGTDDAGLRRFAVQAMYRPPHLHPRIDAFLQAAVPAPFARLLDTSVREVQEERRLKESLRSLGISADPVSGKVRAMYEENPYPRLLSFDRSPPLPAGVWIRSQVPGMRQPESFPAAPRILVAGCGTGGGAIALAMGVPEARVMAVDLSLASLAHAQRSAHRLKVRNIEFLQGDILELDALPGDYDLVQCTGVLHHMADPLAGARALRRRLRPGGLAMLAVYSERARADINVARRDIAGRGLPATPESIRAYRVQILAAPSGTPLSRLARTRDFFSTSGCRDLMFHVQEHQYRLPQFAALLADADLTVVNLAGKLPPGAARSFREFHGDAGDMADLTLWDAVEAHRPAFFFGMIQVWCQAPVRG